jgi:hypothetical protein
MTGERGAGFGGVFLPVTRHQIRTHTATVRLGALGNQGFRTGYVED